MYRQPAAMSASRDRRPGRVAVSEDPFGLEGVGSRSPIAVSPSADRPKLTASASTVTVGPKIPIAAPPSGGPITLELHITDDRRPLAASRSPGDTICFRYAPLAEVNAMSAAASTAETIIICARLSQPSQ
jgi:hypothetical protein